MNTGMRELNHSEMERVAAGKRPSPTDGIVDFFVWAACGFNHHYVPTGKVRTEIDLVFPVKFYQVRCVDCGHKTWLRGDPPNVQGPKINPNAMN